MSKGRAAAIANTPGASKRKRIHTNGNGVAIMTIRHARTVKIVAGDTLKPTSTHLSTRKISGQRRGASGS